MTLTRVQIGDVVRLYGYRGHFEVMPTTTGRPDAFYASSLSKPNCGWSALECSVVEINGQPVPLLSCPIAMPADDYPHEPQFAYIDGPEDNGHHILAKWKEQQLIAS